MLEGVNRPGEASLPVLPLDLNPAQRLLFPNQVEDRRQLQERRGTALL